MSDSDSTLTELLDIIAVSLEGDDVTVGALVDAMGERSFSAILLIVALIMVSPFSGIPGSPTVSGALYLLICIQMLLARDALWLPRRLRRLRIPTRRLRRALEWLRAPLRRIDPVIRTRLTALTDRPLGLLAILCCLAIAVVMPVMELLPFASSFASGVIALFATGLMARDGVFVLLGYLTVAAIALVALGLI